MKRISLKILAVLLMLAMLAVSLPLTSVADGVGEAIAAASEKLSETESVEHPYLELDDGVVNVKVSKSNGGFRIATAEGDLLTKGDDNADLTYADGIYDSSFTTFRLSEGGVKKDYIFGRNYSDVGVPTSAVNVYKSADNAITAEWSVDGVTFKQTVALMGADSYQHGMAYVTYGVTNTSGRKIDSIEARVLMDTALGAQDWAVYMLAQADGSYTMIDRERSVTGEDYRTYFFAYDSKTAPTVTAYTLNASVAGEEIRPKRVTFAHWYNLASTPFEYTPSATDPLDFTDVYGSIEHLTADSAVALYYDVPVSTETQAIGLYYGVYSNYNAGDADVSLNYTSSSTMFFTEDGGAYKDLNGALAGNLSTTLKVQNIADGEIKRLAVAIYPEEFVIPFDGKSPVTDLSPIKPYYKILENVKAGEALDVRFDFEVFPTPVTSYRRVKVVIYNVSNQSGSYVFEDENTVLEDEFYILCPASDSAALEFSGMSPTSVFHRGKRYAYITGSNFGLIRDKSQYRILLRPNNGGEEIVLDQDKVVVNPELNTATLVLDMELEPATYSVVIDWNDTTVTDVVSDALRLTVTDVPTPGDPGYVSSGVYGIVAVERSGKSYDIVRYDDEAAFASTKTEKKDIMLVLRGDINVLSTEENGNVKAEGVTLFPGEVIQINDTLDVKDGRVTVTKVLDENGKQKEITVDIDGKVYTTRANTKVWDGVLAITSFCEGKGYTLPVYSEQGVPSLRKGEEDYERVTLLWPGAAGAAQTLVGLLLNFRYGEFALMKQGGSEERVLSFGAALDSSILVPGGQVGTHAHYSNLEKKQMEMGVSAYTAQQLRDTDTQYKKDQAAWRAEQRGTLNLYMDDILFGAGGFIGFNTTIEVGIPAYVDGMPYVEGTLSLKVINDYWEFGVEGAADLMVFEMEATLRFKSYKSIPVPDEFYFFIGGVNPGLPVDPFGVFWVRGAGAGISDIYETFFGRQTIPPLTLTISGEFALFAVLSARADLSLSMQGISVMLSKVGVAGITLIDRVGGSVYWYPTFSLSFGIRVDILDALVGEGSIVLRETPDGFYFCGYASVSIRIPKKIWIIGGMKLGSAAVGVDTDKIWGSASIIGIGISVKYHWGGSVKVSLGKDYGTPPMPQFAPLLLSDVPVLADPVRGETLYMSLTNDFSLLSDPLSTDPDAVAVTSDGDGRTHRFTLTPSFNRDALMSLTYAAENELAALDARGAIRVSVGGESYPIAFVDPSYDANGAENAGTNAIFQYDEETKIATVSVSFTDEAAYGKEIEVTSPVSTAIEVWGIARSVAFEDVRVDDSLSVVTVTGTELSKLSHVAAYAMESDGSLYLLGELAGEEITPDSLSIPISIPQNLPTGDYTLRVIGTVIGADGEESECPMADTSFTYVNPAQPVPATAASLSLGGNYTVRLQAALGTEARDGYLTTLYEVGEDGLTETVFAEQLTELEGEATQATSVTLPLGGRYASTNEEGVTVYTGLEAGKKYVASIQTVRKMPDGSHLYSTPILTEPLSMVAPVLTEPTFSIENAVGVTRGQLAQTVDTVATASPVIRIGGVGEITEGWYAINNGQKENWDGGDIALSDLEDGGYTLTLGGVNETMDVFSGIYTFAIDTEGPSLLLTSPQGGGFFEGSALSVTGITEAGATLEICVENAEPVVVTASENGGFTATLAVDETVAYQTLRVIARDALGNESMPFGCTLTNALLGDPALRAVILCEGRESDGVVVSGEKQLTFAFKAGNRYVTLNQGSAAAARVVWSAQVIEKSASVSSAGVLTGQDGAKGLVTATLGGKTAYAELVSVDLATVPVSLALPASGYVYDGTEKTPAVTLESDEALTLGEDYTVTYLNNVNAGTASAVIRATENGVCVGVRILEFPIARRDLSTGTVTLTDREGQDPDVRVTVDGRVLVRDVDYRVTFTYRADKTEGIVNIEGIGNYRGFLAKEFLDDGVLGDLIDTVTNPRNLIWIIPLSVSVLLLLAAGTVFIIRTVNIAKARKRKEEDLS